MIWSNWGLSILTALECSGDSRLPHLNESLEAGSRHHIFQRRATRPWEDTVAKFCPKHMGRDLTTWDVEYIWQASNIKNLFKPFQAVCQSTKKSGQHTPVWVTLRQFGQKCLDDAGNPLVRPAILGYPRARINALKFWTWCSLLNLSSGWWFQPLWKIWKSVGIILPNTWKNKSHVPNHQPAMVYCGNHQKIPSQSPIVPSKSSPVSGFVGSLPHQGTYASRGCFSQSSPPTAWPRSWNDGIQSGYSEDQWHIRAT